MTQGSDERAAGQSARITAGAADDPLWLHADEARRQRCYLSLVVPWAQLDPQARAWDGSGGTGAWARLMEEAGLLVTTAPPSGEAAGRSTGGEGLTGSPTDAVTVGGTGDVTAGGAGPGGDPEAGAGLAVISDLDLLARDPAGRAAARIAGFAAALRPGGILLLGGPNPEAADAPPLRLSLRDAQAALRAAGLVRLRLLRWEGDQTLAHRPVTLGDVLHGVSPRIALVAQAPGPAAVTEAFRTAFAADPGPDRADLARRFDARLTAGSDNLEQRIGTVEARLAQVAHTTRRRGLRKWLHALRMRRQAQAQPPGREAAAEATSLRPDPLPDPVPLSPPEQAWRARLGGASDRITPG
ncbi:hypothetical protein [Pseudooceanicola aestuarii]|uniref:hypothetical protein n=1 Tax=Pseudooceanicola aestuarii TaxID=2697319 RepID=UPI0013CFE40B|nr:hypothetical protein [Pseudooceanicola aestuarii]